MSVCWLVRDGGKKTHSILVSFWQRGKTLASSTATSSPQLFQPSLQTDKDHWMAVHHIQLADATLAFVTSPHILYARTVSQVGNDAAQLGRPDGGQTEKPRKGTKSNTICFFVSVLQSCDECLTGAWWDSSSPPWPRTDSPILRGQSGSAKGCGNERRKLSGSVGRCCTLWRGRLVLTPARRCESVKEEYEQ